MGRLEFGAVDKCAIVVDLHFVAKLDWVALLSSVLDHFRFHPLILLEGQTQRCIEQVLPLFLRLELLPREINFFRLALHLVKLERLAVGLIRFAWDGLLAHLLQVGVLAHRLKLVFIGVDDGIVLVNQHFYIHVVLAELESDKIVAFIKYSVLLYKHLVHS